MPPKKDKAPKKKDGKNAQSVSKAGATKIPRPSTNVTTPSYSEEPEVSVRFPGVQIECPWPEWDDREFNEEQWDFDLPKSDTKGGTDKKVAKGKKDKGKDKPAEKAKKDEKAGKGKKDKKAEKGKTETKEVNDEVPPPVLPELYMDPEIVELPESLREQLVDWRRAGELYNEDELVLYDETASAYSNLYTANKHIVQSEFMREFLSAVNLLQYLGAQDVFPIEAVTASYAPSTEGQPWQPWHHVYSSCKAGKDEEHRPVLNSMGKYIVRLYFLGRWRRFYVDDLLPVDIGEIPLLPRTFLVPPTGDTSQSVKQELWPALLCKALLKIAALTWNPDTELSDFNIFHCLTGWHVTEVITEDISNERLWGYIQRNCDEFKTEDQEQGKSEEGSEATKKKPKKGSKKDADKSSQKSHPKYVCGLLKDLREISAGAIPEIAPCFSHYVLFRKFRNIEFKAHENKELANWQYFRWIPWALRHNIYNPIPPRPIRIMMITSFMKKCSENILNMAKPEPKKIDLKQIAQSGENSKDKKEKAKPEKAKPAAKDKGGKGKGGKAKGKAKSLPLPQDPSVWLNLEEIREHIKKIIFFQIPSTYPYNIKMSGSAPKISPETIAAKEPKTKGAKDKKNKGMKTKDTKSAVGSKTEDVPQKSGQSDIYWPNSLASCRNVPAYLFIDSLEHISFSVSFTYLNTAALRTGVSTESIIEEENESGHNWPTEVDDEHTSVGYIILENYYFSVIRHVQPTVTISTLGTKSKLFELLPGRHVYKLWIKSNTAYSLHLMSNREMFVASQEKISELMSCECRRLTQLSFEMSDKFYDLVSSFGTKNYPMALRAFYICCKFDKVDQIVQNKKHIPDKIYDAIFNELIVLLKDSIQSETQMQNYVKSLRVLFLDPYIGQQKGELMKNDEDFSEDEGFEEELWEEVSIKETEVINSNYLISEAGGSFIHDDFQHKMYKAAVCIQNFFKFMYLKKLRSYHAAPKQPKSQEIVGNLWKIFQELFADSKREVIVPKLFRNLFKFSELIQKSYRLSEDLEYTLRCDTFKGVVNVIEPGKWTQLIIAEIFCHSEIPMKCRLLFYCPLEIYLVRIFNNDTGEEIRYCVTSLKQNNEGYSVIVFGLNRTAQQMQNVPWKLVAYSSPYDPPLHICDNQMPNCNHLQVSQVIGSMVRNNYIPNVKSVVARCQIKIQHNALVSLAWSSSYEEAEFMITVKCYKGNMIAKMIGRGNVVVPLMLLEYDPNFIATRKISRASTVSGGGENEEENEQPEEDTWKKQEAEQEENVERKKGVPAISGADDLDKSANKNKYQRPKHLQKPELNPTTNMRESDLPTLWFTVEVKILEKSWPLLPEEWDISEEAKRRTYIKTTFVRDENKTPSLSTKTPNEASSEVNITDYAPWWEMRIFMESGDSVSLHEDLTRLHQIQDMKRGWLAKDPDIFERGEKLRNHYYKCVKRNYPYCLPEEINFEDYLFTEEGEEFEGEENESNEASVISKIETASAIHNASQVIIDMDLINPPSRFLENPYKENILKTIPPLQAGLYSQNPRMYTQAEAEAMKFTRMVAGCDFRLENRLHDQETDDMLKQRFRRNGLMLKKHTDIIAKSKEADEDAYSKREEYLKTILEKKKQKDLEEALALKKKLEEEKAAKKLEKGDGKEKKGKKDKDKAKKKKK